MTMELGGGGGDQVRDGSRILREGGNGGCGDGAHC